MLGVEASSVGAACLCVLTKWGKIVYWVCKSHSQRGEAAEPKLELCCCCFCCCSAGLLCVCACVRFVQCWAMRAQIASDSVSVSTCTQQANGNVAHNSWAAAGRESSSSRGWEKESESVRVRARAEHVGQLKWKYSLLINSPLRRPSPTPTAIRKVANFTDNSLSSMLAMPSRAGPMRGVRTTGSATNPLLFTAFRVEHGPEVAVGKWHFLGQTIASGFSPISCKWTQINLILLQVLWMLLT